MSLFELYGADFFDSLFMEGLDRDQAYLRTTNNGTKIPMYLLQTHRSCVECDYYKLGVIYGDEEWEIKTNYKYRISKTEYDKADHVVCDINEDIGEFGVYNVTFNETHCIFGTTKEPVNIYYPIIAVFLIYFCLYLFYLLVTRFFTMSFVKRETGESKKPRIKSLDTFRGISIVIMIFVNLGAGGYEILDHTPWNGIHLADIVFPFFLWIMGACIPISLASQFKKGLTRGSIFRGIKIRSFKLFAVGVFLSSGIYFYKLRMMGVLQRFGVCYFVTATICLYCMKHSLLLDHQNFKPNIWSTLIVSAFAWIPIGILLALYLSIIFMVADDSCEKGYFGPGGLHKHGKYFDCTGGAVGYLDRLILGKHLYHNPTSKEVYQSQIFDPEGLIGCLPSIFHTFIGVHAGITLIVFKAHKSRIISWLTWGALTGILGALLCGFSIEDGLIPINKNLWSLSFVLVTSSASFVLLTFCYVLIDLLKWWHGAPFFYAGMNSIFMYIGHSIASGYFPFSSTVLWIFIAGYLYSIKYFFTL